MSAALYFRRLRKYGFPLLAAIIMGFMAVCAIFPSAIAPYAPTAMNANDVLSSPGSKYWLGTDYFGRDIFSLIVYGSQQSLAIGLVSVIIGGGIGTLIGVIAGYTGRVTDMVLMRFIDVIMTIPGILLALAISAALGASLFNMIIAVSAATIPGYARIMRGQVMSVKGRPFIEAAKAAGATPLAILWKHVLPNSLSPLLVMAAIGIGNAVLVGSSLSFLGLGVHGEVPDWGGLLSLGRGYLTVAWWIATFPGFALTLLVVSMNILGDELRNKLDPKKSRH
ncbi:ABC transporter permease [Cohnella abietis]|uniref:Peptide ABC transporter permease n=1 Tax=Cohnella abietis TaxID=2507935 RepID=A0A3T1CZ57_9BACL|nr:ABC transporter permease [Cohnella abietis]BBI31130.1 peptide ABC transporter permease [Cohnella abietis]